MIVAMIQYQVRYVIALAGWPACELYTVDVGSGLPHSVLQSL